MHFSTTFLLGLCLILPCGGNHEHNGARSETRQHHHLHHQGSRKIHHHSHHQPQHNQQKTLGATKADHGGQETDAEAASWMMGKETERQQQGQKTTKSLTTDSSQRNTGEIHGVYFVVKLDESPPPTESSESSRGRSGGGGGARRVKRYKRETNTVVGDEDGGANGQLSPVITIMNIKAHVVNRFSTTEMSSTITNPSNIDKEANFIVQIPEKAFISNFTMLIDGELFIADVKEKKEAEKEYEEAKKRNETAGKVSSTPRNVIQPVRGMEVFSVSVNVAANNKVDFSLTYQQLLERKLGLYTQLISVRPNQVVQELTVRVKIEESQGISFLNVSLNDTALNDNNYQMIGDSTSREITFSPSASYQRGMNAMKGLNADLKIRYDVNHAEQDAGLVCVDGDYFIHYFSPSGLDPLNKHVVFVIDVSGSMAGEKIQQTMLAMWSILDILRPQDKFQLILFDDKLRFWPAQRRLESVKYETIRAAKRFLGDELKAQGSTNINEALIEACKTLKSQGQWGSNIIVFLTDGQPTAGETEPDKIISNVVEEAGNKVSTFCLGFGSQYELDFDLLKKISYRTGVAEGAVRIYPGIEADDQLRYFFKLVNTPLMYDVKIQYPVDVIIIDSLTRKDFPQYFDGSELVVAGKLKPNSVLDAKSMPVSVAGITTMEVKFEKTVDLSDSCPKVPEGHIRRLYAYMMIKYLLVQEQKTDIQSTQEEIRADALALALEYHLVTPLTSMVITQEATNVDTNYVGLEMVELHASSMSGRAVNNVATQSSLVLALFFSALLSTL